MILGKLLLHTENLKFSSIFYLSFCKKYNFSTIDNTQATLYKWCKDQTSEMLHVCLHQWDSTGIFFPGRKGTRERYNSVPPHDQLHLPLSFHQRFWFPQRKLLRRLFVYVPLSIEPQQQFPVEIKKRFCLVSWLSQVPHICLRTIHHFSRKT